MKETLFLMPTFLSEIFLTLSRCSDLKLFLNTFVFTKLLHKLVHLNPVFTCVYDFFVGLDNTKLRRPVRLQIGGRGNF